MENMKKNPRAYSMGVFKTIDPLYSVASQFQTLIAEGMATRTVNPLKIIFAGPDWPLGNMWCPQTKKPIKAMAMLLMATKR